MVSRIIWWAAAARRSRPSSAMPCSPPTSAPATDFIPAAGVGDSIPFLLAITPGHSIGGAAGRKGGAGGTTPAASPAKPAAVKEAGAATGAGSCCFVVQALPVSVTRTDLALHMEHLQCLNIFGAWKNCQIFCTLKCCWRQCHSQGIDVYQVVCGWPRCSPMSGMGCHGCSHMLTFC